MSDSKPLNYNLRWIERTFNSRAATEALLAPEREAGNVSHNDYDAAVQFSTSVYPYYRFIGALLGTPITIALRRPSWGNGRTFGCLLVTTFAGSFAGQAMTVSAHLKFIRSLENPSGFGQAIENIQKNSGLPFPRGPTIARAPYVILVAFVSDTALLSSTVTRTCVNVYTGHFKAFDQSSK
ncbi:hypothetical protein DXG01_000139 [Tephrocybe rancida]|nr:hypothetical protein DXG01_000139 [Tephrocybe rancida]